MLKLYFAPNTCALASHIALEEAGVDFEIVRVDFATSEQRSADYLRINPKGRVPSLVTPRGTLTETPSILAFIAQSMPGAALAPIDDAFGFARVQEFGYTICDPYLFTLAQWWEADGVDSTSLPKLRDHGRRMRQRPAVARALAAEMT